MTYIDPSDPLWQFFKPYEIKRYFESRDIYDLDNRDYEDMSNGTFSSRKSEERHKHPLYVRFRDGTSLP